MSNIRKRTKLLVLLKNAKGPAGPALRRHLARARSPSARLRSAKAFVVSVTPRQQFANKVLLLAMQQNGFLGKHEAKKQGPSTNFNEISAGFLAESLVEISLEFRRPQGTVLRNCQEKRYCKIRFTELLGINWNYLKKYNFVL